MTASLAARLRQQAEEMLALADLLEPENHLSPVWIKDGFGIADRIECRLRALGLSAREASIQASGAPDTIRNILRAARDGRFYSPRCDTLHAIARVLEVSPSWLMAGESVASS